MLESEIDSVYYSIIVLAESIPNSEYAVKMVELIDYMDDDESIKDLLSDPLPPMLFIDHPHLHAIRQLVNFTIPKYDSANMNRRIAKAISDMFPE